MTTSATSFFVVTGAAGFVGSEIVRQLVARGFRVRAMARRLEQLDHLVGEHVEPVAADLRDRDALARVMTGAAGVYHIAALFRQADQPDEVYHVVNVQGVRNVIDAASAAGITRLIHCSTVGVLGHVEHPPADEQTPYNPGDIYQRTKMEGEKIALEAFASGAIGGVVIRPSMIYGPGDTRTLKLFKMVARKQFFYVGCGGNLVHFIDVRDLARAFILAMEHRERNGGVYIIAGQRAMPLREFASEVARVIGVPPPWIKLPVKPLQWIGSACEAVCVPLGINPPIYRRRVDFYTKDRSFNGTKAQSELSFTPAQPVEAEIRDIVADYRARGWL